MDSLQYKRILFLGKPDAGVLDVVKDLSGSAPSPDINGSIAGLTHTWDVETTYYSASLPIWIDELSDVEQWKTEFLKPEAKEVVAAVGAWVLCFRDSVQGSSTNDSALPSEAEAAMKAVHEILEKHSASYGGDVVALAVAMPSPGHRMQEQQQRDKQGTAQESASSDLAAQREDVCLQYTFEYIDYTATGKNEYGEKMGLERIKEALEANEWEAAPASDEDADLDEIDFDDMDSGIPFFMRRDRSWYGREQAEMTAEFFGVKGVLRREDEDDDDVEEENDATGEELQEQDHTGASVDNSFNDTSVPEADQVDSLDRMMGRLLAVREQSSDLPLPQRKRIAAKAVRDILQEHPEL